MENEKILKPFTYICPECRRSFDFAFPESLDRFKGLHKLQHELAAYKFGRQQATKPSLDELTLDKYDVKFLKECGIQI
jgi:hypothetical protein